MIQQAIVCLLLVVPALCGEYGPHVTMVTQDIYDSQIRNSDKPWVLDFYGTYCPACVDFVPEYKKLAARMHGAVNFGAINSDDEFLLTTKYDPMYLPSVYLVRRGQEPVLYDPHADRSAAAIENFLRQNGVSGGAGGSSGRAGNNNQGQQAPCRPGEPCARKPPCKKGEPCDRNDYGFDFDFHAHSSSVEHLDRKFLRTVKRAGQPFLIEFYAEYCPACNDFKPVLEQIASSFSGRMRAGMVDIDRAGKKADKYNIQYLPGVLLFVPGRSRPFSYDPNNDRSYGAVSRWVQSKLARYERRQARRRNRRQAN